MSAAEARATWAVLGAGSILPRAGYGCAGYALRARPGAKVTLFDCGPGSVRALGAAGIDLSDVERVVLSHYHVDHCLDLFALAFARNSPALQPAPPLEIVGPPGLAQILERGERSLARWAKDPRAETTEVALDARGEAELRRGALRLRCVANGHTPEAVSWRADIEGAPSLAYTGDTPFEPRVAELASGVDLFVVECSHPDGLGVPGHLTPTSAAELARVSGCRRLLLTHFYPDLDPAAARAVAARTFRGPIELARDGSVHSI
jgi:ribonuclease BN (tRNA processing enzyme)